MIQEYINLTELHSTLDAFDSGNIKKMNKIANKILKLADTIFKANGRSEFQKILKHKNRSIRSWAAFNLIERMEPDESVTNEAMRVIEELAKSDSLDAPGAQLWLKNWKKI